MSTLTADPKVGKMEPWQSSATATATADDQDSDRYLVIHYGDEYDDFDEYDVPDDPETLASIERRLDRIDAEMAAGTWVGHSTEEVFDWLHKKFPQVFGVKHA